MEARAPKGGRRTESEREVQAELRAFAVMVGAMRARMKELIPIVEALPGHTLVSKASDDGDDDRHSIAWSIAGFLHEGEAQRLFEHLRYEAGLTEADAARIEAESRARSNSVREELARKREEQKTLHAAIVATAEKAERAAQQLRELLPRPARRRARVGAPAGK